MKFHQESKAMLTIAMYNREVRIDAGVLKLNGGSEIVGTLEKPTYNYQVNMGVHFFEPAVIKYIPQG